MVNALKILSEDNNSCNNSMLRRGSSGAGVNTQVGLNQQNHCHAMARESWIDIFLSLDDDHNGVVDLSELVVGLKRGVLTRLIIACDVSCLVCRLELTLPSSLLTSTSSGSTSTMTE